MSIKTRQDMGLPTFDDFEVLKQSFLLAAEEPDATVGQAHNGSGLFVKLERTFIDLDFLKWPPLTICLSGLLRTVPGGQKMVLRYRELAHHTTTENSSLNHDYIFEAVEGNLIEFGQSIRACPEITAPRQEIFSNDELFTQADEGARILRTELGNQLEITAGDCGVLFDRMMALIV